MDENKVKKCNNCKYARKPSYTEPCYTCLLNTDTAYNKWQPKE